MAIILEPSTHSQMLHLGAIDFLDVLTLSSVNKSARQKFNEFDSWRNHQFTCMLLKRCTLLVNGRCDEYQYLCQVEQVRAKAGFPKQAFKRIQTLSANPELAAKTSDVQSAFRTLAVTAAENHSDCSFDHVWKILEQSKKHNSKHFDYVLTDVIEKYAKSGKLHLFDRLLQIAKYYLSVSNPSQYNESILHIATALVKSTIKTNHIRARELVKDLDLKTRVLIECEISLCERGNIASVMSSPLFQGQNDFFYYDIAEWRMRITDETTVADTLEISTRIMSSEYLNPTFIKLASQQSPEVRFRVATACQTRRPLKCEETVRAILNQPVHYYTQAIAIIGAYFQNPCEDSIKTATQIINTLTENIRRDLLYDSMSICLEKIKTLTPFEIRSVQDHFDPSQQFRLFLALAKSLYGKKIKFGDNINFAQTTFNLLNSPRSETSQFTDAELLIHLGKSGFFPRE